MADLHRCSLDSRHRCTPDADLGPKRWQCLDGSKQAFDGKEFCAVFTINWKAEAVVFSHTVSAELYKPSSHLMRKGDRKEFTRRTILIKASDEFAFNWTLQNASNLSHVLTLSKIQGTALKGETANLTLDFDESAFVDHKEGDRINDKILFPAKQTMGSLT